MKQLCYKNPSFLGIMELMKYFFTEITSHAISAEKVGDYINIQFMDEDNTEKNLKFTIK